MLFCWYHYTIKQGRGILRTYSDHGKLEWPEQKLSKNNPQFVVLVEKDSFLLKIELKFAIYKNESKISYFLIKIVKLLQSKIDKVKVAKMHG